MSRTLYRLSFSLGPRVHPDMAEAQAHFLQNPDHNIVVRCAVVAPDTADESPQEVTWSCWTCKPPPGYEPERLTQRN